MLTDHLPRARLGLLPTPLHPLDRLSRVLGGPRIWIKRDDLTGLGDGGNKVRKLEFLLGDALRQGADTVITSGAAQSNHARQTAAAASRLNLRCILALGGEPPLQMTGNLLLDHIFGAEIRWMGSERYGERTKTSAEEVVRSQGGLPYIIPYGGSSEVGAAGFAEALAEVLAQASEVGQTFDRLVFASSSGATQAGLIAGALALGFHGQVLGISVDKTDTGLRPVIQDLAGRTAALLNISTPVPASAVVLREEYLGGGYAVLGEQDKEAIFLLARTEGLLLDPVYTGRAMAGLLDLIRRGEIGPHETVLFWHTGGLPALYAYADQLL